MYVEVNHSTISDLHTQPVEFQEDGYTVLKTDVRLKNAFWSQYSPIELDLTAPFDFSILALLAAGSSSPYFSFKDVPASAWYYDAVKSAWKTNLINGVTETEFRPEENMTVAQAIKLAAALHQLNYRGKASLQNGRPSWYSTYVQYAVDNDLIEPAYGNYTAAQMNAAVTRAEFVHIFHAAADDLREMNTVADNAIPDVKTGDAFAAEIYNFYRAGVLTGSDANGTFHPADSIKRSEVATILIRMYDSSTRVLCTF